MIIGGAVIGGTLLAGVTGGYMLGTGKFSSQPADEKSVEEKLIETAYFECATNKACISPNNYAKFMVKEYRELQNLKPNIPDHMSVNHISEDQKKKLHYCKAECSKILY